MRATEDTFDLRAGLATADPEIAALIELEVERNGAAINLIASESYCPRATLEAEASILVTKNATGYPGAREVGGCEVFDRIEMLAIGRAKALFGAEHANVQSVAATLANIAVLRALLKPGDRILSLDETAGGHHSHGAEYHVSGQDYQATHFGVDEEAGGIDVAAVRSLAERVRPRMMIVGSTAYPRAIPFSQLAAIASDVGAYFMADIAHVVGLVVAGLHENPTAVSDVVTTSTHKTFCGPRTGGLVLCKQRHAKAIDEAIFPAMQGAPGAHIIAARAVLFAVAGRDGFRALMLRVVENAGALAAALRRAGFPLYLGGTDTHMVILDLRGHDVDGRTVERGLERHGLVANRVTLPEKPNAKSRVGVRLGTTAMSMRGMGEDGCAAVGTLIAEVLRGRGEHDTAVERRCRELARAYPIPAATFG
jgi:glycine hydroxymethyltransferase